MRKGQTIVLKEVFSFALGLAVMITVSGLFVNVLSPEILRMSVNVQLNSLLTQINSLITETESLIDDFNKSVTINAGLPGMIGSTQFRVYIDNNELCVKTMGQFVIRQCAELRINSTVTGNYLSGSDFQINALKNSSGVFLEFKNNL